MDRHKTLSKWTCPALGGNPDRLRWNAKYEQGDVASAPFTAAPWLADVLDLGVPAGPVLELASGRSGTALLLAEAGRDVTAVDVSDVALRQLQHEASSRGLSDRLTLVHADLAQWDAGGKQFALVLSRLFWDIDAFNLGHRAVLPDGLLAWEALVPSEAEAGQRMSRHRIKPSDLSAVLPDDFTVLLDIAASCGSRPSRVVVARRSCVRPVGTSNTACSSSA